MAAIKPKFTCTRCGKKAFKIYHTVWDEELCLDCLLIRFDWVMHQDKLKLYEAVASITFYAKDKQDAENKLLQMYASDDAMTLREPFTWMIRYAEDEVNKDYKQYKPPEAMIKRWNKAAKKKIRKRQEA